MPTLKLTQPAVERLKPPAEGRVEYWDSQLPGFGLRVAAPRAGRPGDGRRTWQVMYRVRGRLVRETIGTVAIIPNVAEARELARQSLRKAQQGIDPAEERRQAAGVAAREAEAAASRARDTLGALIDRYLAERPVDRSRRPISAEYFAEISRTLIHDVKPALGTRPLDQLTGDDIKGLVRGISKDRPSQANHVLAYLSVIFGWAVDEGLTEKNPTKGVKPPAQKVERDRALDDAEIRVFWSACEDIGWPFGPLAQLLLLTAQRRDELACATWAEFDLGRQTWTLPAERAKNGRAHIIHLPRLAVEILENLPRLGKKGWVFSTGLGGSDTPISGFGRGRERISVAMAALMGHPVDHFTLHDLRRSAATGMAALGIAPHVVDKILNHSGGKISGIAKVYNRFEYLPEREASLEAWARHIEGLVHPPAGNVIALAAAR